jgi:AcrR family transcriptional regulator
MDAQTAAGLPLAGQRRERRDAAVNRERILEAAKSLLREHGAIAVSIDAVAAAAGVGKGTIFRRFGDRAGLTEALIDEPIRKLQDGFLSGPPPLGPGAPPAERLEAFVDALLRVEDEILELLLAVEFAASGPRARVYSSFAVHVRHLVAELDPELDPVVTAELLLGSYSASIIWQLRRVQGADLATIQAGARALLRGLTRAG